MKQRIEAGSVKRIIFDDSMDMEKEFEFELEADSSLEFIAIVRGTIEHFSIIVRLIGDNAQAHIKGLYLLKKTQKLTFKTEQLHQALHTSSSCIVKGILYDASNAQYQGVIHIEPQAHHTDARQLNKNILLSPKARAQSMPTLQVLTKQVKCSHGSAVGNLDQEIVFYMKTRGLNEQQAQRLLLEGFAAEITDALPLDRAMLIKKLII